METANAKNGVSVRAYKGDAMTMLAFDLDESKTQNFTGFTIRIKPGTRAPYFMTNLLTYPPDIQTTNQIKPEDAHSTKFAPIQKFRWVHVPATFHVTSPFYGSYQYEVTPRYLVDDILQPLDDALTVAVTIDVSPYQAGDFQIGFARGFVSSQAYTNHFGDNNKVRPNKTDLLFDIKTKSGSAKRIKNGQAVTEDYTFEDQHTWLGWQARLRVLEFLDETLADPELVLDAFVFDLDEPLICQKLLQLAQEGRVRILLDNSASHVGQDAAGTVVFEDQFETLFQQKATGSSEILRGRFQSLAHSKVFIQKEKATDAPVKLLTGSTNFATNGLYINANHVIVFSNKKVAELYGKVFDASFSADKMKNFKDSSFALDDHVFTESQTPAMTIRFSPHTNAVATVFFKTISDRIKAAETDVLFAVMKDNSASSILDAIKFVRENSTDIFSYGITDTTSTITLYKPHTKRGVRVAGKGGAHVLPPPFDKESATPGIAIHHKFVVVDFKGREPVVYCGSSNLAFNPEQKNGDNLIEIRDRDAVTVFAIEAIRLVDHFAFRDRKQNPDEIHLHANEETPWFESYYDSEDLHSLERELLIAKPKT